MTDISSKIVDYFIQLGLPFEEVSQNMWVIHDEFDDIDNIVVSIEDPLVIFRVKLMDIPSSNKEKFFERLLYLNSESLVHGAYALENNSVIIVDTLELENLDINEFQASIDAIIIAIRQDYKELSSYLTK